MEMQSVLTQMTPLLSMNTRDSNMAGSKLEGKGKTSFQDYMTGNAKQSDTPVWRKQNGGTQLQKKADVQLKTVNELPEKKDIMQESSQPIVPAKSETYDKKLVADAVAEQERLENLPDTEMVVTELPIVQSIVHEWTEEVEEAVCQELDLEPEELEEIMAELGMQLVNLQNLPDIQQFVMAVAGTEDKADLLTNEMLATQVVSVEETFWQVTNVIAEEYKVDDGDIIGYLEQIPQPEELEKLSEEEVILPQTEDYESEQPDLQAQISKKNPYKMSKEVSEDSLVRKQEEPLQIPKDISTAPVRENGNKELADEEKLTVKLTPVETREETKADNLLSQEAVLEPESENVFLAKVEKKAVSDEIQIEEKDVQGDLTFSDVKETGKEPEIEITVEKQVDKTEESLMENGKEGRAFSDSNKKQSSHSLFEHFIENLSVNRTSNLEQPHMKIDAVAQMREIVTQVVEQIKVRVNADTTSMEIQLNPENLGKVNLTVVAKEGHVTAQLITENEIARQALEGQIQQLRETLGEQGLKVDEVEVAVSNFDFSHSNQANAEEQRQQQTQEQRRNQRRLNLNETINLNELSEEGQLAVKIMTENGNQVDYTA